MSCHSCDSFLSSSYDTVNTASLVPPMKDITVFVISEETTYYVPIPDTFSAVIEDKWRAPESPYGLISVPKDAGVWPTV